MFLAHILGAEEQAKLAERIRQAEEQAKEAEHVRGDEEQAKEAERIREAEEQAKAAGFEDHVHEEEVKSMGEIANADKERHHENQCGYEDSDVNIHRNYKT